MGLYEYIGIGIIILILLVGLPIKLHTRRRVKHLMAYRGVSRRADLKGEIE